MQSSNFGRICKATDKTDFIKLADSMTVTNLKTPVLLHGQNYESVALSKYEEIFGRAPRKCGIFVSESYPFIAASPDGIGDNEKFVEVKCPFVVKDKLITPKTAIPGRKRRKYFS